jgi:hypothetical protein
MIAIHQINNNNKNNNKNNNMIQIHIKIHNNLKMFNLMIIYL